MPHSRDIATALALLVAGLATRAALDKLLALAPDWTLVAHWAQAQSLFDLVLAVTTAGVGQGVAVFAARKESEPSSLIAQALAWGLVVSGVAALVLLVATPLLNLALGREVAPAGAVGALAICGGLVATAPALFACLWQGRRRRGRMIALTFAGWAPMALGASGLFGAPDMKLLLIIQIATQLVLAAALVLPLARGRLADAFASLRVSPLRRYLLAGVSIGLMSPASVLWSRAELAHRLSWDEVAQVQALWRASEWVAGIAGGLIGLVFLPRMAAAASRSAFLAETNRTFRAIVLPAALVYVLFWTARGWIVPLLYSEKFLMPASATALFLLGDALRIASWVPLHALFASERTTAIAIGEFLSLPLFALLLTILPDASLVVAGGAWAATFAVYFAFNMWCVQRLPGRYARG